MALVQEAEAWKCLVIEGRRQDFVQRQRVLEQWDFRSYKH